MPDKIIYYDSRAISAHGGRDAAVFLMNEAPGPDEAEGGLPLFGRQGANLFHTLRKAKVGWALRFEHFSWPISASASGARVELKHAFLECRAKYMACTNAYPYWPRSELTDRGFVAPEVDRVLSAGNLARIRGEITDSHRVLLVCGANAYLACRGETLGAPGEREGSPLDHAELKAINQRLKSKFEHGWYLGHTRRWSAKQSVIQTALKHVEGQAGW